jgi:hypothetical protein
MKLTMTPNGWFSLGPQIDQRENNVIQYLVQGLSANDRVTIDATTTVQEGTTWAITRNGKDTGKYNTASELHKGPL